MLELFFLVDVMWYDVCDFFGLEYVDELLVKKDGSGWEVLSELGSFVVIELIVGVFIVLGGVYFFFFIYKINWLIFMIGEFLLLF